MRHQKTPQVIAVMHNGTGQFKVVQFFEDDHENVWDYTIAPDLNARNARIVFRAFKFDNYKVKTIKPKLPPSAFTKF